MVAKAKVPVVKRGRGRPLNARNKVTQEAIEHAKATGEMPLAYMLRIMRMEKKPKGYDQQEWDHRRDAMATAAAPYVHNRLTAVTHAGDPNKPIKHVHTGMTPAEAAKAYQDFIKGGE